MKIEIDTTNLAQLERQERDLDIALETVRLALKKVRESAVQEAASSQCQTNHVNAELSKNRHPRIAAALSTVFHRLPAEFTTREIIGALAQDRLAASRGAIFNTVREFIGAGKLQIVQVGAGRRPTRYSKLNA